MHYTNNTLVELQDAGAASYFTDCALRDSFFRAFTVHYTNNTLVERNVAFNVSGFAFYLEDALRRETHSTTISPVRQEF